MHHMQKKAAAKKYGPLLTGDNGEAAVTEAMKADQFTDEEIAEVIFAIKSEPSEGEEQAPPPPPSPNVGDQAPPDSIKPKTLNKVYEEYPVEPVYEPITDQLGKVLGQKLKSFRKTDTKPLKTTSIHPDRAEELNAQSVNTRVRLYEVV